MIDAWGRCEILRESRPRSLPKYLPGVDSLGPDLLDWKFTIILGCIWIWKWQNENKKMDLRFEGERGWERMNQFESDKISICLKLMNMLWLIYFFLRELKLKGIDDFENWIILEIIESKY